MKKKRVVVAMSGGVDSSVTAGLMLEEGYDVIGVTLKLYNDSHDTVKAKSCCVGRDVFDAQLVAKHFGFPHYVLDFSQEFKKDVINPFMDDYAQGKTPIPCILCNETVKFRDLYHVSQEFNADYLATGHYVQCLKKSDNVEMHRGIDFTKDQSYFLFSTTYKQLCFLKFPLGGMTKIETRAHAKRFDLKIHSKPDSQDICFVSKHYTNTIEKLRPSAFQPGDILDLSNRVIGQHQGIARYTIGQRKGLGISVGEPLYVIKIDAKNNCIYVGYEEDLACRKVILERVNWLLPKVPKIDLCNDIEIKFRSTHEPIPAKINFQNNEYSVEFLESEYGLSPGQACVFYKGSQVLGGGWIRNV